MVGGLIEQQKVGRMQQHLEQSVAIALASGEHADAFEDIVSGEKKTAEQAAKLRLRGRGREFAQVVENAGFGIEFLVLVLREVVGMDFVAEFVFTRRQLLLLGQQLDQGRLPCPVDAHQSDALAPLNHEIYMGKDLVFVDAALAVTFRDIREFGDDASARLRLRKRKMNSLLFFRNFDPLHFFQLFDTALHLLGLGCRIAKTVDENFELLDAVVLGLVSRLELFLARGLAG